MERRRKYSGRRRQSRYCGCVIGLSIRAKVSQFVVKKYWIRKSWTSIEHLSVRGVLSGVRPFRLLHEMRHAPGCNAIAILAECRNRNGASCQSDRRNSGRRWRLWTSLQSFSCPCCLASFPVYFRRAAGVWWPASELQNHGVIVRLSAGCRTACASNRDHNCCTIDTWGVNSEQCQAFILRKTDVAPRCERNFSLVQKQKCWNYIDYPS